MRDPGGKPRSVAQVHAEWVGLLRADGPFIAVPVLADVFRQGLDTVPDDVSDKLRLAWTEVREAPDLLTPAWEQLVLAELLGYTPQALAEGGALPADLAAGRDRQAAPRCRRLRPGRVGRQGGAAADLPAARGQRAHQGGPGSAVARRAGRRAVPPPGDTAGAADQRPLCGCWSMPGPASRPARRCSTRTCGWRSGTCCGPSRACSAPAGFCRRRRQDGSHSCKPGGAVRPQRRGAGRGHRHARHPGPAGRRAAGRRAVPAGPRIRGGVLLGASSRARSTGARSRS